MFTGIVQAVGRVTACTPRGGDLRLVVDASALGLDDVAIGDSIAVSGVCLTVVERDARTFAADLSNETLARTTLGKAEPGARVNLEKALRLADRLGGHLVSGHVDGLATVARIDDDGRAQRWQFRVPKPLSRYLAEKGSVCLDGVSLTVNGVGIDEAGIDVFDVALIPHTLDVTTLCDRAVGDVVNIEVDLMARYAERLFAERTR